MSERPTGSLLYGDFGNLLLRLNHTAKKTLQILDLIVEETGAYVEMGDLPVVDADPSQMLLLKIFWKTR